MSDPQSGRLALDGNQPNRNLSKGALQKQVCDTSTSAVSRASDVDSNEGQGHKRNKRRAQPAWVFLVGFLVALAVGNTTAPRSELYVNLACRDHEPTPVVDKPVHPASLPWSRAGLLQSDSHFNSAAITMSAAGVPVGGLAQVVDPAVCKKDPKVQALTARLSMSRS